LNARFKVSVQKELKHL